jgi:xanthine/CO dehydrogenase XdhC/CoxF family maturation factor
MKDVLDILAAYHAMTQAGGRAALATVVGVAGSAYRRPGAKMLILEDGRTVGAISGGCLENDVAEHAQQVIAGGAPKLVAYDTRSEDDEAWGVGMGCNGEILIFIEPLVSDAPDNPLLLLNRFSRSGASPSPLQPSFARTATADALPDFALPQRPTRCLFRTTTLRFLNRSPTRCAPSSPPENRGRKLSPPATRMRKRFWNTFRRRRT